MADEKKMQPVVILPPNTVSDADVQLLRNNGLCVVVSENPAAIKFIDPLPALSSRTQIEHAAILLSRKILNKDTCPWNDDTRGNVARMFVEILAKGTPLDVRGTREEQDQRAFDDAKLCEIQRLAREEAKAERLAEKAKKVTK